MTTADDQAERNVQNADITGDNPDAKAPAEDERTPAQKAADTRAANKAAKENAPSPKDHAPADLRSKDRVSSGGGKHDKDPIVHLFEFENGYAAKVYQRQRDGSWEWAPMRDGKVLRAIPGLSRVPAEATVEVINEGLELVAALDA